MKKVTHFWKWEPLQRHRITAELPLSLCQVPGDTTAHPTRWYNHWYLVCWGWTRVAIITVSEDTAAKGYFAGYQPGAEKRRAMTYGEIMHYRTFGVLVGREPCNFFVITAKAPDYDSPPVIYSRTVGRRDPLFKNFPLL